MSKSPNKPIRKTEAPTSVPAGVGPPSAAPPPATPRRIARRLARFLAPWLALSVVLVLAGLLRFSGLNWDERSHIHPDERFLAMVLNQLVWPKSFAEYLDESRSPLNPRNRDFRFFSYGTLPTTLVKGAAIVLDRARLFQPRHRIYNTYWQAYDNVQLLGRAMSGAFDLLTILFAFLLARTLYGDTRVSLLAAFLVAVSVAHVQHAHFFVVDPFATCFITGALYFLARVQMKERLLDHFFSGVFFGLAMGSKVSVFVFAGVVALVAFLLVRRQWLRDRARGKNPLPRTTWVVARFVLMALVALAVFRVAQPDAFAGPGFFDMKPCARWRSNIEEVRGINVTGLREVPFTMQWVGRTPYWFPWKNMVLWGMGPALGLAAWAGWLVAAFVLAGFGAPRPRASGTNGGSDVCAGNRARGSRAIHLIPVAWTGIVFFQQSRAWTPTMRYFLPAYPTLAVLGAWLLIFLYDAARRAKKRDGRERTAWTRWTPALCAILISAVCILTLLWAVAFTSIYRRPQSRIAASRWVFKNVPRGSTIATEHWDDPIPLAVDGLSPFRDLYKEVQMRWYEDDNTGKLNRAIQSLDSIDYIALSSNRLYGSIPRLPMRYPMTTRYYEALFDGRGRLGFDKVADIASYPSLFGVTIPDHSAEEAFTVLDHPRVLIFKKTGRYSSQKAREILGDVDWGALVRMGARNANQAPNMLRPTPREREVYEKGGTFRAIFPRASLPNRFPVLFWLLTIEALGLIGWPYLVAAGRGLPDRGYAFAKTAGLLLASWAAWMTASVHAAAFGRPLAFGAVAAVGLGAVWIAWRRREEIRDLVRRRWATLALGEIVFLAFFGFGLWVKWVNPDLWHPWRGGEKSMNMAYFLATVKSVRFPPYDPWFAGMYLNYYYWGYVPVALATLLTGIAPEVVYNLAMPTIFALVASGAFGATLALAAPLERRRKIGARLLVAAVLSAVFAVVIGNLGEARMMAEGIAKRSRLDAKVSLARRAADGLGVALKNSSAKNLVNREWWQRACGISPADSYWNPSRAITYPRTEAAPITEFPYFSFLYGDMHPHFLSLPLTLLALGLTVGVARASVTRASRPWAADKTFSLSTPSIPSTPSTSSTPSTQNTSQIATLLLLALSIGSLWSTNSWDYPTYGLLALAGLGLFEYAKRRTIGLDEAIRVGVTWIVLMAVSVFLFLPFRLKFGAGYTRFVPWTGSRTPLGDFLVVHGFFLFVVGSVLVADFAFGRGHNAGVWFVRGCLRSLARQLSAELRQGVFFGVAFSGVALFGRTRATGSLDPKRLRRFWRLGWRLAGPAMRVAPTLGLLALGAVVAAGWFLAHWGYAAPAVGVWIAGAAALLAFRRRPDPAWQLFLVVTALALAISVAVEFFVVQGDIARMNTVFKFYMQVWILLSVASAVALARMGRFARPRRLLAVRVPWYAAFVLLFGAALLYPLFATPARLRERYPGATRRTLDGMAFMDTGEWSYKNQRFPLAQDKKAIEWMRDNIQGSPTICEAAMDNYTWGHRYAMFTGLPIVIGAVWPVQQHAAVLPGELASKRFSEVNVLYNADTPEDAMRIVSRYGIEYIVVGPIERAAYTPQGLAKFEAGVGKYWDKEYDDSGVRIYRVRKN